MVVSKHIVSYVSKKIPRGRWLTAREVTNVVPSTYLHGLTVQEVPVVMRRIGAKRRVNVNTVEYLVEGEQ